MNSGERLFVTVSLAVVPIALSLFLDPIDVTGPAGRMPWDIGPINTVGLFGAMAVALVVTGTHSTISSHPALNLARQRYVVAFLVLPALLTAGAMIFLHNFAFLGPGFRVSGIVFTSVLLAGVIKAEYHTVDGNDKWRRASRAALNLAAYVTAFILFVNIYSYRVRSIQSASAVLLISALLAIEMYRAAPQHIARAWTYSIVTGIIVGEATWALNYWVASGLAGGAYLVFIFYALTGIIRNSFYHRLTPRVAAEFAVVAVTGFALVFLFTY